MRKLCLTLGLLAGLSTTASQAAQHPTPITESSAVRAIVGEAGNQGYTGMLAVACAIRNRGSLQGVYGIKSPNLQHQPPSVWANAHQAWIQSAKHDTVKGATHWDNVKQFGRPYWAAFMKPTVKVKDHQFYRK